MNLPFEALQLPLKKEFIVLTDFIDEYTSAVKQLAVLNEKLGTNDIYSSYTINHLMKMESLYSTRIEGTHTTIDKVYEAEIDSNVEKISVDIEEVQKYNDALLEGVALMHESNLITNKVIKKLHRTLLSGKVRKNSNFQAGEFRVYQNRVGEHIPPIASEVANLMGNLEKYVNEDLDGLQPLIKVAIVHAQFETIHPFPDGNGRVGRVLIPLYLYKMGEIRTPVFFLSQELEKNKIKYEAYLQGTRQKDIDGFSTWIKFFLECVAKQCKKDVDFIVDIDNLYKEVSKKLKKQVNSNNVDEIVRAIFETPIFTCKKLGQKTGIKETTVRKYIQSLIKLKIIIAAQQKRNKKYYFIDLLDKLNRD